MSKQYPISEIFISPQGEGLYTGTLMAFVRLAGCPVGKPFPKEKYKPDNHGFAGLPIYTEMCTMYDGRTFPCDTDFRVKERLTVTEIFDRIRRLEKGPPGTDLYTRHLCLTGGEPFIHELDEIHEACKARLVRLHVETSGTIPFAKAFPKIKGSFDDHRIWITVSPKFKVLPEMIARSDEMKILVDKDFKVGNLPPGTYNHPLVYIQPVNFEHEVDRDNLRRVIELQKKYPMWRVSLQLHKILSDYIGERVL